MYGNDMCLICREKNTHSQLDKLRRMIQIVPQVERSEEKVTFHWGITKRCKYGISCSDLERKNCEAKLLATQLEPYLITIAKSENTLYYTVIDYLRGDFPSVYTTMERLHQKAKKDCK